MSSTTSPTVSRRWLALEMRRLRKERRLSQAAVAEALGCQVPKVSHIETGQRPLQDADLKVLLELFKVPDDERQPYVDALARAHERGWWDDYDDATLPAWLVPFLGLEQGAQGLKAYQPALVHGLLQTPHYAAAIYRGLTGDWSEQKISRYVELRLRRQEILLRQTEPTELAVVLDEAALHHMVGDRRIMAAQLEHVVELCRAQDNITVQVVPFDRGGSYEAAYGSFTILTFPYAKDPGAVYMEHHLGGVVLDALLEIDKYSALFEQLSHQALQPDDSLEMLLSTAKTYSRSR